MKKIILVTLLAAISLSSFSQTNSGLWNSSTATYTNSTHKITWQLLEDFDWIGRPILSGSTLLKVRNDDLHVMVTLGATKENSPQGDIWNRADKKIPGDDEMHEQLAKHNGMIYLGAKVLKSQLCGIHALKYRYDMKKDYPEYNQTVHSIEIVYYIFKGDYFYTVSVMSLSVVEEEIDLFDKIATLIFNGFSIK